MTLQTDFVPVQRSHLRELYLQVLFAACIVALADWLFFDHPVGVTYSIFLATLALSAVVANLREIEIRELARAGIILVAALLPGIETLNPLTLAIGLAGTITFVLFVHRQLRSDAMACVWAMQSFLLRIPVRLLSDANRIYKVSRGRKLLDGYKSGLSAWVIPIALTLVFLGLFAAANPMIERWLSGVDLSRLTRELDLVRIIFWCAMLVFCWPFIRTRFKRQNAKRPKSPTTSTDDTVAEKSDWLNEAQVTRSLILFNILFAVQTCLDAAYLWGGIELPAGMTYAAYAHRGAYTLIFTALIAAAFVLFATRPGTGYENSRIVKVLVVLWTVQNVILIGSCVLRLGLYIEVFSLTYWRVSALIWMALVLIGLNLIISRIVLQRSNAWLINMNLVALMLVLYAVSFVNMPYVIADYNVSVATASRSKNLDIHYLLRLGEQAIPAIDKAIANNQQLRLTNDGTPPNHLSVVWLSDVTGCRHRCSTSCGIGGHGA